MPDMLTIAAGLVDGANKATDNFMRVSASMQERERQKKIDDYSFKQAELQIKKDEEYLSPEMTEARREQIKTQQKNAKVSFSMDLAKLRKMRTEAEQEKGIYTAILARMGETAQNEQVDFTGVLPQGTTHKIGRYSFKGGSAKVSKDEELGNAVGAYERGEISLDDLYREYSPSKVDKKIDALLPPLPPDPRFEVGGGWSAYKSKHKAKLNDATIQELKYIKTPRDLQNVLENQAELEAEGVDVKAIKEYHADKLEGLGRAGSKKEISLPDNIKKTSEAIGYLMEEKGMTEDEAVDWIRSK